jgi:hypothetical protein
VISHRFAGRRSGAPVSPAKECVKVTVECLQEPMHVKNVIDIRGAARLLKWRSIECFDLCLGTVNYGRDECLRLTVRTTDR